MVATGHVGVAFGLVVGAGLATVLGSAIVFVLKALTPRLLAASLGFAAGVMLYVTFAEIFMRESVENWVNAGYSDDAAYRLATVCFFGGMVVVAILDHLLHMVMHHSDAISAVLCAPFQRVGQWAQRKQLVPQCWSRRAIACDGDCRGKAAADDSDASQDAGSAGSASGKRLEQEATKLPEQLVEPDSRREASSSEDLDVEAGGCDNPGCCDRPPARKAGDGPPSVIVAGAPPEGANDVMAVLESDTHTADLRRMGFLVAVALGIHNIPEGIATFSGSLHDVKVGAGLAVAIGIHNIPEGICVSVPIYYATRSKWTAFLWGAIPGMFEPLGGLIAYLALSGDNPLAYGIVFAMVAGIMVFIAIRELLPSAYRYDPMDKITSLTVIMGMVIMAASLVLFTL